MKTAIARILTLSILIFASALQANEGSDTRLEELLDKLSAASISKEEIQEFSEIVRSSPLYEERIKNQELKVSESAADADQRLELAQLYLYKVWFVKNPMEKGEWSQKAEQQWEIVLQQDPQHWKARYQLATSLSHYPAFLNRQQDAIEHCQKLLEQQGPETLEKELRSIYITLSKLYEKTGDKSQSQAIAQKGLAKFPHNQALQTLSGANALQ